jgi:hypothetical protein
MELCTDQYCPAVLGPPTMLEARLSRAAAFQGVADPEEIR